MRRLALIPLIGVAACASTQTPSTPMPGTQTVLSSSTTSGLRITPNTMTKVDTIQTSFDRVWTMLPNVYTELEIPVEHFDPQARLIGNESLKLYRRLGKTPLTRYLDCGATQIGPNAESYEVRLSILTRVQRVPSDSSQTSVATTLEATAQPVQFKGDPVRCTSKGALETRIAQVLKIHLAP